MNSPTASGFSNWPPSPTRRPCPTRWLRCWVWLSNRAKPWPRAWLPHWRTGCGCWYSTTASTCATPAADLVEAILARSATVTDSGHQPRRVGVGRRATLAGAVFGCRRRDRVGRGRPIRRTRAQRVTELLARRTRRRRGGGGGLSPPRRDPVGDRAGGLADGVDESAIEVRDRLDQRFRLLVGSRRGLERHQTLRHAVAWSYDLSDDDENALLARCSVFAGGFDLQSACVDSGFR